MCGLVGIYRRDSSCPEDRLAAMRDELVHRGPDDAGIHIDGRVGLGHRRLSIIDLGGGHQPMQTGDGRYTIAYNGEIYNYRELRRELERGGSTFRTQSDTEVILELHARYGDDAVERLNGIFAYAVWDGERKRLLLARDRAGIKPLYFGSGPDGVAFASEIKALFHSGFVTRDLNHDRIAEYLIFRHVAGDDTLFRNVSSLPPGHTLEIVDGRTSAPRRYWSIRETSDAFERSYDDAVDALDAELNRAVSSQLMSDVPLGTFCSGGIDSSLTTAIAAKHSTNPINTFSVGFHEADFDESRYARMAADACHSVHHEIKVDEAEYAQLLPKMVWHHDLPLNFANSVHIYAVSRLAKQHVTVVLTGEGADELFGGYPRYYIPRLLGLFDRLPKLLRGPLLPLIAHAPDHRLRKLAQFGSRSRDDVLLFNSTGTPASSVLALMPNSTRLALEFRRDCVDAARRRSLDALSAVAELDFQSYLRSILDRQDKMSMATSIEARVPFLDNGIIDFARSLPAHYKQTFRRRKRVLKSVALRYLPAGIVHRRKSGFGVPLQSWFANAGPMARLLHDAIGSPEIRELLDSTALAGLLAEHRARRGDHSELLWGVLNLSLWRQAFRC